MTQLMPLEVLPTADRAAARAAARIAQSLRTAIAERGVASLALSGGATPGAMLGRLSEQKVDWTRVHIFQVDERMVAAGDPSRNLRNMLGALSPCIVQSSRIHAMPVEEADPDVAAARYFELLRSVAGTPPALDVVQLGLGADGHTASLVPGDPVLDADTDVAASGTYDGLRRMTLTLNTINRARQRIFLVTGAAKRVPLRLLEHADPSIVASRVTSKGTVIVADRDAAGRDP